MATVLVLALAGAGYELITCPPPAGGATTINQYLDRGAAAAANLGS